MTATEINARLEELEPQIDAAAEAGDTATFEKLGAEMDALVNRLLYGPIEPEGD